MTILRACDIALLDRELPCEDGVPDTIQDTLGASPRDSINLLLNGGKVGIILILFALVIRSLGNSSIVSLTYECHVEEV